MLRKKCSFCGSFGTHHHACPSGRFFLSHSRRDWQKGFEAGLCGYYGSSDLLALKKRYSEHFILGVETGIVEQNVLLDSIFGK